MHQSPATPCFLAFIPHCYRHKRRELARAREHAQRKSLRTLLTGMSSEHFTKMNDFDDVLRTYTPMCFVVTDLENSTGMAAADKAAYTQLQQLHDVVRCARVLFCLDGGGVSAGGTG